MGARKTVRTKQTPAAARASRGKSRPARAAARTTAGNRTGVLRAPAEARRTRQGAEQGSPEPELEPRQADELRLELGATAGPVGTLPPLVDRKGKVARGAQDPAVFLDLLGQRLAFERSGSRLYEALLRKLEVAPEVPEGLSRGELEHIRDEERSHAGLLARAIEALGGDPTAVTPAADAAAAMSFGLVQVVCDPRTSLLQALDAVLAAELVDNDAWQVLIELARHLHHERLASLCEHAREQEEEHLEKVRQWYALAISAEKTVSVRAASIQADHP